MAKCDELHRLGKYIIETLDENGYLTSNVPEIAEAVCGLKKTMKA